MLRIYVFIFCIVLAGCAGKPDVEVEVSNAIFLNPVNLHETPLYISVRNQTNLYGAGDEIYTKTIDLLHKKGFETTKNAKEAEYLLIAVVLNIKKSKKKMGLKDAIALTSVGAVGGAVIGSATAGENAGRSAGVGAGIGAGVGLLGFTIAKLAEEEFWYGTVDIEITQPDESVRKERTDITEEEIVKEDSTERTHSVTKSTSATLGNKRRSKTKLLVRVSASFINEEEAKKEIVKAVSHRLANFF